MKRRGRLTLGRRDFGKIVASASVLGAAGCASDAAELEQRGYLLPPPDASAETTACAYCIVGCGYKVYTWPVGGPSGGLAADENALGQDYPVTPLSPYWISPQMYAVVERDGAPHHIVIMPDPKAEVVNPRGDHTLGASLAQRFYNPAGPTSDRILRPRLRVGNRWVELTWKQAETLMSRLGNHALEQHGVTSWAMKTYSYQGYENTYAITKFCFESLGCPCWAPHDQPSAGSSTPGLKDAGINAFSAAYVDWKEADVLFVSGVALYDAHGVLFSNWVRGGPSLIVVNPRRDETAIYALESGGLHLQVNPGTDALLQNAIAKVIVDSGWHDQAFVEAWTATEADILEEADGSRRRRFGLDFDGYAQWLRTSTDLSPGAVAAATGVDAELIVEAARRLAEPNPDGSRPKASFMFEKGNYWTHNYVNTASLASLGLLVGAGNRPGQVISRAGGHQRGMMEAAPYPIEASPQRTDGKPVELNLDRWVLDGNVRFAWVIGCTWGGGGTAGTQLLRDRIEQLARDPTLPQVDATIAADGRVDLDAVIDRLSKKMDRGGMVLAQQDLYHQGLTELADLFLPATGWGEMTFARMQGERRLRLYPQVADPPGQTRPDWKIVAAIAQKMGFDGFDWADSSAVFDAAAQASVGTSADYEPLVVKAAEDGTTGHAYLAAMGTTGIQCPIRREGGQLEGTVRLHEDGFSTASGRAIFVKGDWREVAERHDTLAPRRDELWVINRRHSSTWSSMVEDARNPYRLSQLPNNVLELNPADASRLRVEDGDEVEVSTEPVYVIDPQEYGLARRASFRATAAVVDCVRPGVAVTYFNHLGEPNTAANSVVSNVPDPISGMYPFKLGRGRVRRL